MQIQEARRECSQLLNDGGWHRNAQLLRGHLGDHVVLAAVACELLSALLLEVAHQRVHLRVHTGLRLLRCLHADQSQHANGSQIARKESCVWWQARAEELHSFLARGCLSVCACPHGAIGARRITALQPASPGLQMRLFDVSVAGMGSHHATHARGVAMSLLLHAAPQRHDLSVLAFTGYTGLSIQVPGNCA